MIDLFNELLFKDMKPIGKAEYFVQKSAFRPLFILFAVRTGQAYSDESSTVCSNK